MVDKVDYDLLAEKYPLTKGNFNTTTLKWLVPFEIKEVAIILHPGHLTAEEKAELISDQNNPLWWFAVGLAIPCNDGSYFMMQSPNSMMVLTGFAVGETKTFYLEHYEGSGSMLVEYTGAYDIDDYMMCRFGGFIGDDCEEIFEKMKLAKYGLDPSIKLN